MSYFIYQQSGTVYAKNTITGINDYSGTDFSTVINSAINNLTSGGIITISEGTFIVNSSITVNSNISIIGSGFGTILQAKNTLNTHVIQSNPLGSSNISISNLKIDGNGVNQTSSSSNGIMLGGGTSNYATVQNCYITNVYANGILVLTYNYTNIQSNIINNIKAGHGILYKYANSNAIITQNQISLTGPVGVSGFGIAIDSTNGINSRFTISNNMIYQTGLEGINISSITNPISEVSITGNIIDSSGDSGITLYSSNSLTDITCNSNTCVNNSASGIGLSEIVNSIVCQNVCKNNNQRKQSFSGIDVSNCTSCIIIGNRCYDNQTIHTQNYGISEYGTSSDNIIEKNIVHYNTNGSLYRIT